MRLTIEERDKILKDNFNEWESAYLSKDKKMMYKIQLKTVRYHNQKCNCSTNAVMEKLKSYYIKEGLFTN